MTSGTMTEGSETGIEAALARAERHCAARGARLTNLRRQVLALILQSPVPIGAYALLDKLKPSHAGAAPPTVYRALEFLLKHRLVHRIERLNAFIGCRVGCTEASAAQGHEEHGHAHAAQFLICRRCGRVEEIEDEAVGRALAAAARCAGFAPEHATVEIEGTCSSCRAG
ncbi:transcriptional repressor [Elioraea tepida]|uniref:Transcriptional repressor n=1 Tax=Elioraea tepida TaxID=2843330 RepID=A0A975U2M0_9PROT|nr:Fur family transcriptional regulator [Elioraea tepida]QXM24613.1 transcriptional repressor [Elioraea tepida]